MNKNNKQKLSDARKQLKALDKKWNDLWDKRDKVYPDSKEWKKYDDKMDDIDNKKEEYQNIIFELDVLPALKEEYEGKYFKSDYKDNKSFIYVKKILNENLFNLIGFHYEKSGDNNRVQIINGFYDRNLAQLCKKIDKKEYDEQCNLVFEKLFNEMGIENSYKKQNEIEKQKKEITNQRDIYYNESKTWKKVSDDKGKQIETMGEDIDLLIHFIKKNAIITNKKREDILDKIEHYYG